MLKAAPHLHIRRPSPTTAEFTVTTQPPPTLPLRLLLSVVFLARLLLGSSVLLLLYAKYSQSPYSAPPTSPNPANPPPLFSLATLFLLLDATLSSTSSGAFLANAATQTPVWTLLPPCLAALYLCVCRIHTTESLLVLRGLGIQTSSTSGTWLRGTATRFIPTEKICDVLINEAFKGFEVRYYLIVVVDGEEDLVVVFPRLLPGRKIVEAVWRGVRGCLYEGQAGENGNGVKS
ncbi:GPI-GlcNAc transferase complex [Coniochaeta sp. 2T2.1]|nr:GPI-GlcNAc transferase complex [Coniochaeta sp. 2T2.1]